MTARGGYRSHIGSRTHTDAVPAPLVLFSQVPSGNVDPDHQYVSDTRNRQLHENEHGQLCMFVRERDRETERE